MVQALFGQVLIGLINGSFYALLSLGLAVIFRQLGVVPFAHAAQYMMGAFAAWMAAEYLGIGYGWSLLLVPIAMGIVGAGLERLVLRRLQGLDPLYGLLLTFGLTLVAEGLFHQAYGNSGYSYPVPEALQGGVRLGAVYLPLYRGWVVVVSIF